MIQHLTTVGALTVALFLMGTPAGAAPQ